MSRELKLTLVRTTARAIRATHGHSLHSLAVVPFLLLALGLSACGTMSGGRGWGQDATLAPGWGRVGRAAWNATVAPETWIPAAGALALQFGHADESVVDWAAKNTPVYGSQQNADQMSDHLKHASAALWIVSGVATPSGDGFEQWSLNKARGFAVQLSSGFLLRETVGYMKGATDRTRPNGAGQSFPSAHASGTSHYNTQTSKNVEALEWSTATTTATQVGLGALTVATAWARVEANQHYPSDVLAGMALGHFFGAFFTDAFIGIDDPRNLTILFEPARDGIAATVRFNF